MVQVAFVTYEDSPEIVDDDLLTAELLRKDGISVVSASWDNPSVDWKRFHCVVIRSPWNYYFHPARYAEWLHSCQSAGVKLWNPPKAVLANLNKRYLVELEQHGIGIVPTVFLPAGSDASLQKLLEKRGWNAAVIKPAISAGAHLTWKSSLAQAGKDENRFTEQCRTSEVLVQPFMEEIATEGEISLIFFRGKFSHSVVKRPADGDFRVQHQHGGSYQKFEPSWELISQAETILKNVDSPLLYARVDGVVRAGRFLLMELEINEPYLFLSYSPEAPFRFAEAIRSVL